MFLQQLWGFFWPRKFQENSKNREFSCQENSKKIPENANVPMYMIFIWFMLQLLCIWCSYIGGRRHMWVTTALAACGGFLYQECSYLCQEHSWLLHTHMYMCTPIHTHTYIYIYIYIYIYTYIYIYYIYIYIYIYI